MATDEDKTEAAEKDGWGSNQWSGFAFLPIGITFMVLGLNDNTTFFIIGVMFLGLAAAMFTMPDGETTESGSTAASDDEHQYPDPSAVENMDPTTVPEDEEKQS